MRVLILVVFCMAFSSVWAEHEVDHRYNIRGYILDKNEQPISNQNVQVFDGSQMLAEGKTDSAGFYSLHLHLHNSDKGRKLRLRSGSNEAEIRATFDVDDLSTLREHDANFVGDEFIEAALNRFRIPPWSYPLAGLIIVAFIAVKLEKRRKRKLREKHSAPTPKKKHKRRRKH